MELGRKFQRNLKKTRKTQQKMELYPRVQSFAIFWLKEDLVMALGHDIITMGNLTAVKSSFMVDVMAMKTIFMLRWHVKQSVRNQNNQKTLRFLMLYLVIL